MGGVLMDPITLALAKKYTDKQIENHGPGSTSWDSITGKPESFPPSSHDHPIEQIEGLQSSLDEKALSTSVGDLNTLETAEKSSLVNAINEINEKSGGSGGGEIWETISNVTVDFNPTSMIDFKNLTPYKKLRIIITTMTLSAASILNIQTNYNTTEYSGNRTTGATTTAYTAGLASTVSIAKGLYVNAVFDIDLTGSSVYLTGYLATSSSATVNDRATAYFFRGLYKWWSTPTIQINLATSTAKMEQGFITLLGVRA